MLIETTTVVQKLGRRDVLLCTNFGFGEIRVELYTEKGEWVLIDVATGNGFRTFNLDVPTRFTPDPGTYVQIL